MLNLLKQTEPYERFHLQVGPPVPHVTKIFGVIKRVTWSNVQLSDGSPGSFVSWWLIGNAIHWYQGTAKCDGTRTRMYWAGQLDDGLGEPYVPDLNRYVMTTTDKERRAVRFFVDPGEPTWDGMGGS